MTLSSILPGLRDIRGPLAAGYLYLLCGWLWFNDDLERRARDGPVADVYDLLVSMRPAELIIVLSVSAFLVGSLLDEVRVHLARAFSRRSWKLTFTRPGATMVRQLVSRRVDRAEGRLVAEGLSPDHELVPAAPTPEDVRLELDRVRDSLEGSHSNLLAAIDRNKSEADFRAAISVPLLLLVATFAVASPLWALAAIPVAGLVGQAVRLRRTYGDKLAQALEDRIAESPSLAVYEQGVSAAIEAESERSQYQRAVRDADTARERADAAAMLIPRLIRDFASAVALHGDDEPALRRLYVDRVAEAFDSGVAVGDVAFVDRLSTDTARWLVDNDVLPDGAERTEALDRLRERVAASRRE